MTDITVAPIDLEAVDSKPGSGEPLLARDLSMLGHVKVRVDVRLGSAEINIHRLFSLTKGDAIELDTSLDSPVSLMLDGKTIAKGQLVAAGDFFGLKITDILQ